MLSDIELMCEFFVVLVLRLAEKPNFSVLDSVSFVFNSSKLYLLKRKSYLTLGSGCDIVLLTSTVFAARPRRLFVAPTELYLSFLIYIVALFGNKCASVIFVE